MSTLPSYAHLALCRYVDTANSLRRAAKSHTVIPVSTVHHAALRDVADRFNVIFAWWAMLYVLIEGYRQVDGADPAIDALLADDIRVNQLRLFRNGTFHFQNEPIHDKLLGFAQLLGADQWADDLQDAFDLYVKSLFPDLEAMYAGEVDLRLMPQRT
jgi:hypothetical protein